MALMSKRLVLHVIVLLAPRFAFRRVLSYFRYAPTFPSEDNTFLVPVVSCVGHLLCLSPWLGMR